MRLLSDASEYVLRTVVWLAQQPQVPHKTKEIAAHIRAAPGYLVKVLQGLARAGIVSGARGSAGGFTLIREADDMTVLEVVNAVDPIQRIHHCPLDLEEHDGRLCLMHQRIDEALAAVEASFAQTAVGSLGRGNARAPALCPGVLSASSSGAAKRICARRVAVRRKPARGAGRRTS